MIDKIGNLFMAIWDILCHRLPFGFTLCIGILIGMWVILFAVSDNKKSYTEFATWLRDNYQPLAPNLNDWCSVKDNKKIYTTGELYNLWRRESENRKI